MQPAELPSYELSPDIEWLMHNSQRGEPERVIAALREMIVLVGRPALWTAIEMLAGQAVPDEQENRQIARQVAVHGLLRMIAKGQRYQVGTDMVVWACEAVMEEVWERRRSWKADILLPPGLPGEETRLAWLFNAVFGLSPDGRMQLLKRSSVSENQTLFADPWNDAEIDAMLAVAEKLVLQEPLNSAPPVDKKLISASLSEVVIVLAAVIGIVLVTWILNSVNPNPEQALTLDLITPHVYTPTPSPNWEATAIAKELIPLDENSTFDQISLRMRNQNYENLWQDLFITYFGPRGFNGQPVAWRTAFWYENASGRFIMANGPSDSPPYYLQYFDYGAIQQGQVRGRLSSLGGAIVMGFEPILTSEPASTPQPTDQNGAGDLSTPVLLPGLVNLWAVFPEGIDIDESTLSYEVLPVKEIAGRSAVGFQVRDEAGVIIEKVYIDAVYGWFLEREIFSLSSPGTLLLQMRTSQIEYNLPALLEWASGDFPVIIGYHPVPLERNSQVARVTPTWTGWLPAQTEYTPPNFDWAEANLSFHYDMLIEPNTNWIFQIQLYAGKYQVGEIYAHLPPDTIAMCRRSPDGQKIAFEGVSGPLPENMASEVSWIDLRDLAESNRQAAQVGENHGSHEVLSSIYLPASSNSSSFPPENVYYPGHSIRELEFSPDGNQLMVVTEGWKGTTGGGITYYRPGGIYITNLEDDGSATASQASEPGSGVRLLAIIHEGRSLVWKPDGSQVALIVVPSNTEQVESEPLSFTEEIWILDVQTGNIIYREVLQQTSDAIQPDWPLSTWGVNFPLVKAFGLEGCVQASNP